jgi:hypothetical protein
VSNRVTHSKETYIIFNMTVLWWRGNKIISSSQCMKWHKVITITRQSVCTVIMFLQSGKCNISCPCAHQDGTWERAGTTPHIINPVLLHTVPSDNIVVTILSMLTFLPLHKWNMWLFYTLHILVSQFLLVTDIWHNKYKHFCTFIMLRAWIIHYTTFKSNIAIHLL